MKQWLLIQQRYVLLSLREKLLILLTGLVLIIFPGYLLWIEPNAVQVQVKKQSIEVTTQDISSNAELISLTEQKLSQDPNAKLHKQLANTEKLMQRIDALLAEQQLGLIPVGEMAHVLEQLLLQRPGIQLLSMHSLAAEPVLESINGEQHQLNFYRHGIRLHLESDYFSLVSYLQALEGLPQRFLWQFLDYEVSEYPKAEVILEIYTLSATKDFIRG